MAMKAMGTLPRLSLKIMDLLIKGLGKPLTDLKNEGWTIASSLMARKISFHGSGFSSSDSPHLVRYNNGMEKIK